MQKPIALSPRIRYFPLEDEEGCVGVMYLVPGGPGHEERRVVSIQDKKDFRFYFNEMRLKEDKQYLWGLYKDADVGSSEGKGC
ncbi:predicted protein [Cyanophage PSS2]|uniref:hypothetical protein n=1 Tax=Cyanophage PSS2 TaxID=658401 RepID=UPI0001B04035|nr:hypothetical protein PSS2_gp094 [Cyanophage PSS2]ACT65656.1 hypothetical protein [Cyanophage PSS2]ACY75797.1 predicted protein [Cyanophage PSS2]